MAFFGDPYFHQPRSPANPRLLKALSSASGSNDVAVRNGLYEALMNSVVLIPTSTVVADSIDPDGTSTFIMVEDERGQPAVPIFTDIQALQRWSPGSVQFISLPMPQFLRETFPPHANGVWVNLADRAGRFVSRSELSQVTSGLIRASYTSQVETELVPVHADFSPSLNTTLPAEIVARMVDAIRREMDVAQAYLMELSPGPKRKRLAVGLRLTRLLEDSQIESLVRRVARSINSARLHRGAIDVLVLDFARHRIVSRMMPPIFERGV
jgi:hypothetical protein